MSRTLKRPMFRKGGEVMEGIMTGIKPRESFAEKGITNDMLDRVRSRVNLIDAVAGAGASPLADPLTQFLLQTGQNLIAGESAGGTKLQEIVGATRKPLADFKSKMKRRKGGGMVYQLYGGSTKDFSDGNKFIQSFYDKGGK